MAAALGFPSLIPASALGRNGAVTPSDRIGLGFIGMGGQGLANLCNPAMEDYNLAGGFIGKSDVHVAAVCDVDLVRLNHARDLVNRIYADKECAAYHDFRELLARPEIDAVVIATPDHWHALIGIAAVKAGKDVYGEKPLAHNILEGRAICDTVQRFGAVWQTGCQQRSWKQFRAAAELVQNGYLGEVKTVRVSLPAGTSSNLPVKPIPVPEGFDYDFWLGPAPREPYCAGRCHGSFRNNSDYSSGPIADWAGHHVDSAQWGMGTDYKWPVEIEGEGTFQRGGLFDNMVTYRIECRYAEGFTMIIEDNANRPEGRDGKRFSRCTFGWNIGVLFEGSQGWIQVNRGGMDVFPDSLAKVKIGPKGIHLYHSEDHKQNFLDCIRSRQLTAAPAEVAHHSVGIGYLGITALHLKRKLRWDGEKERLIDNEEANRRLGRSMRSPWHL
jgi:predicted dehydrogenase